MSDHVDDKRLLRILLEALIEVLPPNKKARGLELSQQLLEEEISISDYPVHIPKYESVSIAEAAKMLGLSASWLNQRIHDLTIPLEVYGLGRRRVLVRSIKEALKTKLAPPNAYEMFSLRLREPYRRNTSRNWLS